MGKHCTLLPSPEWTVELKQEVLAWWFYTEGKITAIIKSRRGTQKEAGSTFITPC